jgi:hypothetical protein
MFPFSNKKHKDTNLTHFTELLEREEATIHIAIDDCTGRILGTYFDKEETLKGYYNVFHQILIEYGIPYEFMTDTRTVLGYELKNKKELIEDTFTQFSYACHKLVIDIKTSSVPQAKEQG